MNTKIFVAVLVLISLPLSAVVAAAAQPAAATPAAPDVKPAVSLKVKRASSSTKGGSRSSSYYYSYYNSDYRNVTSSMVLDAELRSLSKDPVTIKLEWYFIAKVMASGKQWVCDKGSKDIELVPPASTVKEHIESRTLQGVHANSGWLGYREQEGSKIDGYIVLARWQGKILKVETSTKSLEDLAMSPDKLQKMMVNPDWYNAPSDGRGPSAPPARP